MHLSPSEYVIHIFGGVRKTARALGLSAPAVSAWRSSKLRKCQIGSVPGRAQKKILEVARARGLDITADDLIFGRNIGVEVYA